MINRYPHAIRMPMAHACEKLSPLSGKIEIDKSFFGARRVKSKRGRGAYGKTIVFGLIQRQDLVYTQIDPDCAQSTL